MTAETANFPAWDRLREGWRWWSAEVAILLPASVRNLIEASRTVIAIEMDDGDVVVRRLSQAAGQEIARVPATDPAMLARVLDTQRGSGKLGREPVILLLPDRLALRRKLTLPLAAKRRLSDVLHHEIDRQSPVEAALVYHDYRIVGLDHTAGTLEVELRIVERAKVDEAVALCHSAGIGIAVIALVDDMGPTDGGNFPADAPAAARMRLRYRMPQLALGLFLVLILAGLAGLYAYNDARQRALDAELAVAGQEALAVGSLSREIAMSAKREQFLNDQKRSVMVVKLLNEVSHVLPAGSWLYEFEYGNGEVRIHGFSHAAASLIALFDASPLFSDAQFRAPLMQGPGNNLERFDMSFHIRGAAS